MKLTKGTANLEATDDVMFVNNIRHSFFSNCEVFFNNEQVYTANGLRTLGAQSSLMSFREQRERNNLFQFVKDMNMRRNLQPMERNLLSSKKEGRMMNPAFMEN